MPMAHPCFVLAWLLLATHAGATDGLIEINQACAAGPGCFAADSPGFPVEINVQGGSYRLTSDLEVPGVTAIEVAPAADPLAIDLNGFEIRTCRLVTDRRCSWEDVEAASLELEKTSGSRR